MIVVEGRRGFVYEGGEASGFIRAFGKFENALQCAYARTVSNPRSFASRAPGNAPEVRGLVGRLEVEDLRREEEGVEREISAGGEEEGRRARGIERRRRRATLALFRSRPMMPAGERRRVRAFRNFPCETPTPETRAHLERDVAEGAVGRVADAADAAGGDAAGHFV
jgi:hypothetical protein